MTEIAAVEKRVGRPKNREKHAEVVRLSEEKIIERFEEITDAALEMALGRTPEICPYHHGPLRCSHGEEVEVELGPDKKGEPVYAMATVLDCAAVSRGFPRNEKMLVYAIDRIAGRPAVAGAERQLQADFIRKVGRYVAQIFNEANGKETPEERAREFAVGMANIWNMVEVTE